MYFYLLWNLDTPGIIDNHLTILFCIILKYFLLIKMLAEMWGIMFGILERS
jgi:hypothetical protein